MKFYLCSGTTFADDMESHRLALEARGHKVVSRWHQMERPMLTLADPGLKSRARMDLGDIEDADVLLAFAGGGVNKRGGRHYEAGYAHAVGLEVWLVGEPEHAFHTLATRHFKDWAYVLQFVESVL